MTSRAHRRHAGIALGAPFGYLKVMPPERQVESRAEVLRGTLEMLALNLLSVEPMHGWGLSLKLREISRDVFDVNQGSLYPALQAMLRRGWIRAEWRASDNNRRARYYSITAEGRKQLVAEIEEWQRASAAVNRVLRYAFLGA
jgi:PadR family transcriptional regulator